MRRMVAGMAMWLLTGASDARPRLPDWMAGCWIQQQGETWSEECWTAPRAGIMLGSGRSGVGEQLKSWEMMQIVLSKPDTGVKMAFWGAPQGVNRTLFAWRSDPAPGVTFTNVAHDYPQRIRYWREGANLLAEVSLADGSKAMRWRYRPR